MDAILKWWPVWSAVLVWIVTGTIAWTKMGDRINGVGRRVKAEEDRITGMEARLTHVAADLQEYRRDAQEASKGLARVEKGMEDLQHTVSVGISAIGGQIRDLERLWSDKDAVLRERVTRVETAQELQQRG